MFYSMRMKWRIYEFLKCESCQERGRQSNKTVGQTATASSFAWVERKAGDVPELSGIKLKWYLC